MDCTCGKTKHASPSYASAACSNFCVFMKTLRRLLSTVKWYNCITILLQIAALPGSLFSSSIFIPPSTDACKSSLSALFTQLPLTESAPLSVRLPICYSSVHSKQLVTCVLAVAWIIMIHELNEEGLNRVYRNTLWVSRRLTAMVKWWTSIGSYSTDLGWTGHGTNLVHHALQSSYRKLYVRGGPPIHFAVTLRKDCQA